MRTEIEEPLRISSINWRITWLILSFAAVSLTASVLPLWPDIQEKLPLDPLERGDALAFYSCCLLAYMLAVFPLVVRRPREGRGELCWWWVGGMILGFAAIPLFVLAYIGGVHLRGAIGVLLWAGILHGAVITALRAARYRHRWMFVAAGLVLGVVLPFNAWIGEALQKDAADRAWSPFESVLRITQDFEDPPLVSLAAALVVLQALAVFGAGRLRRAGPVAAVLTLALLGAAPAPPSAPDVRVFLPAGESVVPGQPMALRLEVSEPGGVWLIEVAGRETYRWSAESGALWLYPVPMGEESVVIRREGDAKPARVVKPRMLPGDRSLVMMLGAEGRPLEGDVPAAWGAEARRLETSDMPPSYEGLLSFSAIVTEASVHARLDDARRRAVDAFVRNGGALLLLRSGDVGQVRHGAGSIRRITGTTLPTEFRPRSVAGHPLEANLYSSFALPDWGEVDLTGLIILIVLYHAAFYMAFLLPLFIDAKKSVGVYLVSVGFVLILVGFAAWFALKSIFLRETQVLQQNVGIYVLAPPGAERPSLHVEQITCFASFNSQPARIELATDDHPRFLHENRLQGAGDIEVASGGTRLILDGLQLDRFRRKQVVKFDRLGDSPLRIERQGDLLHLRPVSGVPDPLGLLLAKRRAAFVRHHGRLYPARLDGDVVRVLRRPTDRSWAGVIPADLMERNAGPFVRHALGRHGTPRGTILVVLLEGVGSVHDDDAYLDRKDICQLLVVPLDRF